MFDGVISLVLFKDGTNPVYKIGNYGMDFWHYSHNSAGSNGNGSLFEYDVPSGYYALNTKILIHMDKI